LFSAADAPKEKRMASAPASPLPQAFARRLLTVLPQLFAAGALPDDWTPQATTYDLPRFQTEAAFIERFVAVVAELAETPRDAAAVNALLASCGHPADYARLGQPLSTVYELLVQAESGAVRALSFASRTKPFLAIAEAYANGRPARMVRIVTPGTLPLSDEKKRALRVASVELHEGVSAEAAGQLPPATDGSLTVFVCDAPGLPTDVPALADQTKADAIVFEVSGGGGGVVLLLNDSIDPKAIQLVRKRTAAALLAVDAKAELARAAKLPTDERAEATPATCEALLQGLFPEVRASATFCTGLAGEAAVFSATARALQKTGPVPLFYAENGYGGTCQLIAELLSRDGVVDPRPLAVLGQDASGNPVTLVDRMLAALDGLGGGPAFLFLETPTNPELQVHDFPRLFAGLRAYEAKHGVQIPVLADTTLAPLYPLLSQPFAKDWPCVIVKSGSKYFTKGKATLGVAFGGEHPVSRAIIEGALAYGRDADTAAKPTQLAALAEGLRDLPARVATIANHTTALAQGLRDALAPYGRELVMYTVTPEQIGQGLASGVLSFYLPKAPTTHADLVDEFVDELLREAPSLVKNRVSYGQSIGSGRPDVFYVINPEESTQGALSAEVKAAQKRDNVQICRISVPEHADVPGLLRVIAGFFARKYG
jgi:cystathionine beta-lyase/cystathionine gamma-synthase